MEFYEFSNPIADNFVIDVDQGVIGGKANKVIQQGEHDARYLQVELVQNGVPVDLTNCDVYFLTRPAKSNDTPTMTACEIFNEEQGHVKIAIKNYMTTNDGIIECEFVRIGHDKTVLPFKKFNLTIDGSIYTSDTIESSEPLHALVDALATVREVEQYLGSEFMDLEAKYAGELSKTNAQLSQDKNYLQNQINNLVLESGGDSNLEIVQARGEYVLLNDRLNAMNSETDKIKKIVTWTTQYIDRSSLIDDSYYTISSNQVIIASASGYKMHKELFFKNGTYKVVGFSTGFTIIKNKNDDTLKRLSEFITDSNDEYGEHEITIDYDFIIYPTTNSQPMMIDKKYFPANYLYGIYNFDFDGVRISIMDNTVTQNMQDIALLKQTLNDKNEVNIAIPSDFATIQEALNSITDSSANKIYNILIEDGTHEFKMLGNFVPNYVNFIGKSGNREKCIIKGEVADSADDNDITNTSTFNIKENNKFKNLTITAKNIRYCIHSESGGVVKDWTQILDNCVLEHYGNQGAIDYRKEHSLGTESQVWTACHAWGEGASSGAYAEFNNCIFKGTVEPWYVHEPTSNDGEKPYIHILNNCDIINTTLSNVPSWLTSVGIDNTTDKGVLNQVVFNNCNFGNGKITINGNFPIDVKIKGSNNVFVRRNGLTTNYPTTDYTIEKTYIGTVPLVGGEVLKYVDGVNLVDKANATTDSSLIAGVAVSTAEQNNLVKIVSKTYINVSGSFGQKIYVDHNGLIATTGTIPIGVCLGECSLLF